MNKRILTTALASFVFSFAAVSQAELIDRGKGLIYDTVLDITWLQNANLADNDDFGVLGVGPDGQMMYATAEDFIEALNSANYKGFNGWRLPAILPQEGGVYNDAEEVDGSADSVYNVTLPGTMYAGSTQSEFAHLHFTTLGNESIWTTSGSENPNCFSGDCLNNEGPFFNIYDNDQEDSGYWSGSPMPQSDDQWVFFFNCGAQCHQSNDSEMFVWPVLDGDVAITATSVPMISMWAVWLLVGMLAVTSMVLIRRNSQT